MRIVEVDAGKPVFRNMDTFPFENHSDNGYRQPDKEKCGKNHERDNPHVWLLMACERFEQEEE